jgi:hypothetical protein
MNDPLIAVVYGITSAMSDITIVEAVHGRVRVASPKGASACNWRMSIFLDKVDNEVSQREVSY